MKNQIHRVGNVLSSGRLFARKERWRTPTQASIERLEARIAPASVITITAGASGSGSQDAAFLSNGGKLLFAAPDVGGNTLSTGALLAIAANADITIQATDSI